MSALLFLPEYTLHSQQSCTDSVKYITPHRVKYITLDSVNFITPDSVKYITPHSVKYITLDSVNFITQVYYSWQCAVYYSWLFLILKTLPTDLGTSWANQIEAGLWMTILLMVRGNYLAMEEPTYQTLASYYA